MTAQGPQELKAQDFLREDPATQQHPQGSHPLNALRTGSSLPLALRELSLPLCTESARRPLSTQCHVRASRQEVPFLQLIGTGCVDGLPWACEHGRALMGAAGPAEEATYTVGVTGHFLIPGSESWGCQGLGTSSPARATSAAAGPSPQDSPPCCPPQRPLGITDRHAPWVPC